MSTFSILMWPYQEKRGSKCILPCWSRCLHKCSGSLPEQRLRASAQVDFLRQPSHLRIRSAWRPPWRACTRTSSVSLNETHFDMVAGHLGEALEELDAALHELAEPAVRPYPLTMVILGVLRGVACGAARAGRAPGAPVPLRLCGFTDCRWTPRELAAPWCSEACSSVHGLACALGALR